MGSKMAPLWLVFKNEDPTGDDVFIMFKNGDGKIRTQGLRITSLKIAFKFATNHARWLS